MCLRLHAPSGSGSCYGERALREMGHGGAGDVHPLFSESILLARLGILGLADLLLFFLLLLLAYVNGDSSLLETGIYMLCPYLLTVFLGLWISRRVHGQECAWVCGAVALGVSLGNTLMYQSIQGFYAPTGFRWWAAAFVLLSAGVAGQCYKTIKEKEAPVWNLG